MKSKQIFSAVLMITVFLSAFVLPATAKEADSAVTTTEVELLPNGDRIETELITYTELGGAKATKSGHKTKSYKNSNGTVMWSVTVYGAFTYDGSSAVCTTATHSTACPGSGWSIVSSSSTKSGNTATAVATARRYYANGTTSDYTYTVTLKCSVNGVLS